MQGSGKPLGSLATGRPPNALRCSDELLHSELAASPTLGICSVMTGLGPFADCQVPARRRNKQTLGNPGASLGRAQLERTKSPARLWHVDSNGAEQEKWCPERLNLWSTKLLWPLRSVPNLHSSAAKLPKMAHPPRRRLSATETAEAAFKAATSKPADPSPKAKPVPAGKELVSVRLDRDVLEHFQEDGAGWQDRINAALRTAAGLD